MENATGDAVQPPAQRRKPDGQKSCLHPRPKLGKLAAKGRGRAGLALSLSNGLGLSNGLALSLSNGLAIWNGRFHARLNGHAMWPCHLFYSGRARRFRARIDANFPRRRLRPGLLSSPAVQRFCGIGHVLEIRQR